MASNLALEAARGEFVALLDHDDELAPDALAEVVRHLNTHPDADVIYSDEDKLDLQRRSAATRSSSPTGRPSTSSRACTRAT